MAIQLSATIKDAVNGAFGRQKPVAVSYVDAAGAPHLSYRGTVQSYGDSQLALWARDPADGIAAAMKVNPAIVLLYGDMDAANRTFLTFRGRGRVETDPAIKTKIFESAHPAEQERDKDRKGVAIIVDLDSVTGLLGGERTALHA